MSETGTGGFEIPRLSIPGYACVHCGTIQDQRLRCSGCGWVDPMTRHPQRSSESQDRS